MKKRTGIMFFCVLYVGILSGLLAVQIQKIAGSAERFTAMAELILLLLFVIVIVIYFLKTPDEKTGKDDVQEVGREEDAQTARREEDAQTTGQNNYAETYARFLMWIAEYGLSEREKEVAWLICRGFTNRQIAEELFIAETTVKKHVTHVYEKCDVSGRKELKEHWRYFT